MYLFNSYKRKSLENKIGIYKYKAVIFDVDGTMYHLKKMYRIMFREVINYYFYHPQNFREINIIIDFIKEREKHALEVVDDVENAQYEWTAIKHKISRQEVRELVERWIFQVPLQHIYSCRRIEVIDLFNSLTIHGIPTGIFSDYPSEAKLKKLGLSTQCIISATDPNVGRLKPDPKGLLLAANILGVSVEDCLLIGDRDDRDGECARRAGMKYFILD